MPTSSYRKRFEAVFTKLGVKISLDSRGNTQDTWEDLHKLANFRQIDGNKRKDSSRFSTINLCLQPRPLFAYVLEARSVLRSAIVRPIVEL